jgi:hypothetical protein
MSATSLLRKESLMRRISAAFTAAAFVITIGAPAFAKTETMKGEIVDQTCYRVVCENWIERLCGLAVVEPE